MPVKKAVLHFRLSLAAGILFTIAYGAHEFGVQTQFIHALMYGMVAGALIFSLSFVYHLILALRKELNYKKQ